MRSALPSALAFILVVGTRGGPADASPPPAAQSPREQGGEGPARPRQTSRIEFVIRTKHSTGPVRCALYDSKKSWLTRRYVFKNTARVFGRLAICVFNDVPAGTYAATGYHDKNDNSKLDRNFLGIPSEDFTFSSGARAGLGPPSFDDADFSYEGGSLRLTGRM